MIGWFLVGAIALQIYWWVFPDDKPRFRRMRERVQIDIDLGFFNRFLRRSHSRGIQ